MATGCNVIIDLTEDREVIVLESGDEAAEDSSRKRARQTTESTSTSTHSGSGTKNESSDASGNGAKRVRRNAKKKRKLTVVGTEEGEIVEPGVEGSELAAKAESREDSNDEEPSRAVANGLSKREVKDAPVRSLLDRLAITGDMALLDTGSDSKQTLSKSKKKSKSKKRKRGDKEQVTPQTNPSSNHDAMSHANGEDDALGSSLFFVDDSPADVPTNAKFAPTPNAPASSSNVGQKAKGETPSLLLPTHVSVFEGDTSGPIQIIAAPTLDSDDEDYIDYLDYDDNRRVCMRPPAVPMV